MARNPNDLYPTPPCAAFALAYALSTYLGVRLASRDVLDPAAGFGTLLEWCGVPRTRRVAFELSTDPRQLEELERRVPAVLIGDALEVPWPVRADVVANPPFALLDAFVRRIVRHHLAETWDAVACILTPIGFWHAQGRADIRPPDWIFALGWRPNFAAGWRVGGKEASSPNQDYCWAVYGRPSGHTVWARLEKPGVPLEAVAEHSRLARIAARVGAP